MLIQSPSLFFWDWSSFLEKFQTVNTNTLLATFRSTNQRAVIISHDLWTTNHRAVMMSADLWKANYGTVNRSPDLSHVRVSVPPLRCVLNNILSILPLFTLLVTCLLQTSFQICCNAFLFSEDLDLSFFDLYQFPCSALVQSFSFAVKSV